MSPVEKKEGGGGRPDVAEITCPGSRSRPLGALVGQWLTFLQLAPNRCHAASASRRRGETRRGADRFPDSLVATLGAWRTPYWCSPRTALASSARPRGPRLLGSQCAYHCASSSACCGRASTRTRFSSTRIVRRSGTTTSNRARARRVAHLSPDRPGRTSVRAEREPYLLHAGTREPSVQCSPIGGLGSFTSSISSRQIRSSSCSAKLASRRGDTRSSASTSCAAN